MSEVDDEPNTPAVSGSPDEIWLNYGDIDVDCRHVECDEVTWSEDPIGPSDVCYVRADIGIDEILLARLAKAEADTETLRALLLSVDANANQLRARVSELEYMLKMTTDMLDWHGGFPRTVVELRAALTPTDAKEQR